MSSAIKSAIFPIAGLGTRFLPATKAVTKEMLPVVDRPLIEYAVNEAKSSGIEKFIFVVADENSLVTQHFSTNSNLEETLRHKQKFYELKLIQDNSLDSRNVFIAKQAEPLGLGHAVLCAKQYIDEEYFTVILPDDLVLSETPCLKQLVDAHNDVGGSILAVEGVDRESVSKYGIMALGRSMNGLIQIDGVVEKPQPEDAPSNLAAIGRYVLSMRVFDYLAQMEKGIGGEIQLTDAINSVIAQESVHALEFKGKRFDCGSKAGYIAANIAYARQDKELMAQVDFLLSQKEN